MTFSTAINKMRYSTLWQIVVMLSVIVLNVFMLSVVVPASSTVL
jgi:hypothetical protein